MLRNTSDGIEVIADGDRMEWYGSNLEGMTRPITFKREGAPPAETTTTIVPTVSFGVYDVDGVEVVTPTQLDELPEQATRVRFVTTIIDSGSGPELCLGGVMESLPPQCSGPVAEGLDMEGWSEEASGVRWGEQSVVVTWPPVDGAVQVLSQSEALASPDLVYPPGELPAECEGIDTDAGAGTINAYANSLGAANGGVYVANDGTLVLQVVGDPEPHREALAGRGRSVCYRGRREVEAEQQQSRIPLPRCSAISRVRPCQLRAQHRAGRTGRGLHSGGGRRRGTDDRQPRGRSEAIRLVGRGILYPEYITSRRTACHDGRTERPGQRSMGIAGSWWDWRAGMGIGQELGT